MKNPIGVFAVGFILCGTLLGLAVMFGIPKIFNTSIKDEKLFLLINTRWLLFGILFVLVGTFLHIIKKTYNQT